MDQNMYVIPYYACYWFKQDTKHIESNWPKRVAKGP